MALQNPAGRTRRVTPPRIGRVALVATAMRSDIFPERSEPRKRSLEGHALVIAPYGNTTSTRKKRNSPLFSSVAVCHVSVASSIRALPLMTARGEECQAVPFLE